MREIEKREEYRTGKLERMKEDNVVGEYQKGGVGGKRKEERRMWKEI